LRVAGRNAYGSMSRSREELPKLVQHLISSAGVARHFASGTCCEWHFTQVCNWHVRRCCVWQFRQKCTWLLCAGAPGLLVGASRPTAGGSHWRLRESRHARGVCRQNVGFHVKGIGSGVCLPCFCSCCCVLATCMLRAAWCVCLARGLFA